MELAAVLGARAAGAPALQIAAFARFGGDLGVGLQMLDDWSGIHIEERLNKGIEDITLGRPTWPWAWLAEDLDGASFTALAERAHNVLSAAEAAGISEQIRTHLEPTAKQRIRTHLGKTLDGLHAALGDARDFNPLIEDVNRLENAYG
jgi:geranylgeranyl pyrophosphate synthase